MIVSENITYLITVHGRYRQTDRQTDGQTGYYGNTALFANVDRVVKTVKNARVFFIKKIVCKRLLHLSVSVCCHVLPQLIIDFYNETYGERYDEHLSEDTLMNLWSLTTALFLPGGMIGSLLGGWLADAIGRYCFRILMCSSRLPPPELFVAL